MDDRDIIALYWQRAERAIHETAARNLALVAVAVLMTASFAAGALSGDKGPETIPIPETGLTVVLPESWRGKCGYELQDGSLGVYLRAARTGEGLDEAGYLFTVECHEGSCDPASDVAARQYVIASTPKETYFLILPSDVQYDPNDAAVAREYQELSQQIGDVQVLLADWLGE